MLRVIRLVKGVYYFVCLAVNVDLMGWNLVRASRIVRALVFFSDIRLIRAIRIVN